MSNPVIRRTEMLSATLNLGGKPIALADYATTGLVAMAIGPRGYGKTNAGLVMAEQLAQQGWVSVLVDPEGELESLYGQAVPDPQTLHERLTERSQPIVVVKAADAPAFIPYGRVILEVADQARKPLFVVIDEAQVFSTSKRAKGDLSESAAILNEFAGRGRKRALDLFVTALRYTGTLDRALFGNKNLTLIGCQEDATAWAALAPQFRGSRLDFGDLNTLLPGQFFCMSRTRVEKVQMPLARALKDVALPTPAVQRQLPGTFSEWDRAMRAIPRERLRRLTEPVVALLSEVAGLSAQQRRGGALALEDELMGKAG